MVLCRVPSKLSSAAARIPIYRIPRALCLEAVWSGCEGEHLSPPGTEVKNACSIFFFFYVLLTVHLSTMFAINQLNAQNLLL